MKKQTMASALAATAKITWSRPLAPLSPTLAMVSLALLGCGDTESTTGTTAETANATPADAAPSTPDAAPTTPEATSAPAPPPCEDGDIRCCAGRINAALADQSPLPYSAEEADIVPILATLERAGLVSCCATLARGWLDTRPADIDPGSDEDVQTHHWTCCNVLEQAPLASGVDIGLACTPWGPPMPPAFDDEAEVSA